MQRMISGIKPTSWSPTLGNYLGAIKEFVKYQDKYELFVFVADLHALTLPITADELKQNTANLLAVYLAAGLDPNKTVIFKQSDIAEHNQLEWLLTCNTNLADFTKMPQYKNYCEKQAGKAIPAGMLLYPSLMNADILLYDAAVVPVGIDQKPHIDLTRDVADSFNKIYPNSFVRPEAILASCGAKIMSLSDPTKKMSKSESENGTIYLLEDLASVRKKITKAITDSENRVAYDPEHKPGISNLMTIYSCLTGKTYDEIEQEFADCKNYGIFKAAVSDAVCTEISVLQEKVANIKQDNVLYNVLCSGYCRAKEIAAKKIDFLYRQIGLR